VKLWLAKRNCHALRELRLAKVVENRRRNDFGHALDQAVRRPSDMAARMGSLWKEGQS